MQPTSSARRPVRALAATGLSLGLGLSAAMLWAANPNLVIPITWASAYNQVLCAFLLLAAFYSHLRWLESGERKWIVAEWAAYLAGFGALEITVMYPALVLLYHLCVGRLGKPRQVGNLPNKQWWDIAALFVPAAAFGAMHAFLIPKTDAGIYTFVVDSRIFTTLSKYVAWTIAPSRMGGLVDEAWRKPGYAATLLIAAALAIFVLSRLWRREGLVIFCIGWFALLIAPVLPLANHLSDYYVTVPAIGAAWLGGWAIAVAWKNGTAMRATVVVLSALYLAGSVAELTAMNTFFYARARRMQGLVAAVEQSVRGHENSIIVVRGVDNDLFQSGFQDDPFKLMGAQKVYLAPGSEAGIQARADLGGITRFKLTTDAMMAALQQNRARILEAGPVHTTDITERFQQIAQAEFLAAHRNFVDVGSPIYAARLGPTWYPVENGFRWMPKVATVTIAGPKTAQDKLYVTGYAAATALASGPVRMRFRAGGTEIGSPLLVQPNMKFEMTFELPAKLIGQYEVEITIEAGKTFKPANDQRDLGMIFGTFEIK